MRIIVTGLESSGTKWMTRLLRLHPAVRESVHTSLPECLMIHECGTRWPDLTGAHAVVWMLRYEPIRLESTRRLNYDDGRSIRFVPPWLYRNCVRIRKSIRCPVVFASYEGLVGPLGRMVFYDVLLRLRLNPRLMPDGFWNPEDANEKYLAPGLTKSNLVTTIA